MVPYSNSYVPVAGQTTTNMKSRPKTSSTSQRHPSLRYMNTSRYSSQILEDKPMTSSSSQPKYYDRPKTSLSQIRDYDKTGMWNSDRSSYQGMLKNELTQSHHKVHTVRSSDPEDDILSRMSSLRIKSSSGVRDTDSVMASTSRQRSVSLLRRLSQSLSARIGMPSPLKDSLRERWLRISKDSGVRMDTPPEETFLSQALAYHSLEASRESSTFSINSSRCDSGKTPRTENSRTPLLLKDTKSKQFGSSEKDFGQRGSLSRSNSIKDFGELTQRSDSNASMKDSNSGTGSISRRQACSKRWQSAGYRLLKANKNVNSVQKHSKREVNRLPKREMTSPRIITINRVSTPSPENEPKSRTPDKGDCRGKCDSSSTPYPPGTPVSQGGHQGAAERPSCASKTCTEPDRNHTPQAITSPISRNPTKQLDVRCTRAGCAVATDAMPELNSGVKPSSEVNATVLQNQQRNTPDKGLTKNSPTTLEESTKPIPNQQIHSSQNVSASLSVSEQFFAQSGVCDEGQRVEETGHVYPRPDNGPQRQGDCPAQTVLLDLSKPQTICIPFSVAADTDSDSSSSTPTVPLSQRVFGSGDGASSSPHPGSSQEVVVGGEVGGWDSRTSELQKLKELELHGNSARPVSRNGTNRKDKVPYDHIQEELRPLGCGVTGSKPQLPLPPNGLKNHALKADHILPPHGPPGQDEDLVAMGTLWSPSHQLQARGSNTITTTTSTVITSSTSNKSLTASFSNGGGGALASISGSLPTRRPVPGTTPASQTLHHSSSITAPTMGNIVKSNKDKDVEPKYSDPVPGAPPSFQQRLMELAALEAETVRWERSKKVKKKPLKQDKDS